MDAIELGPNINNQNAFPLFEVFSKRLSEYEEKKYTLWIGLNGIMQVINKNINTEDVLMKTQKYFHLLMENSNEIVTILADDGTILFKNNAVKDVLGYEPVELIGSNEYYLIHRENKTELSGYLENCNKANTPSSFEHRCRHKNGNWKTLKSTITSVKDENRNSICFILHSHDISDKKILEDELRKSIFEKDMLIQELHHRVRNNMQIVLSILSLQSCRVDESKYHSYFEESRHRIYAMALVHEKLYQSENMTEVDFLQYLVELINNLFKSYDINREQIRLRLDVKEIYFGIVEAVPCAMIFNELILNSIKHAFPDGRSGEIQVSIIRNHKGQNEIIVKDDGIGLPGDFDILTSKTLGMQIVQVLTKQVKGNLDINGSTGTTVTIIF